MQLRAMEWSDYEQKLIDWYLSIKPEDLPRVPFMINRNERVVSNRFYEVIEKGLQIGHRYPYVEDGTVQGMIKKLQTYIREREYAIENCRELGHDPAMYSRYNLPENLSDEIAAYNKNLQLDNELDSI